MALLIKTCLPGMAPSLIMMHRAVTFFRTRARCITGTLITVAHRTINFVLTRLGTGFWTRARSISRALITVAHRTIHFVQTRLGTGFWTGAGAITGTMVTMILHAGTSWTRAVSGIRVDTLTRTGNTIIPGARLELLL